MYVQYRFSFKTIPFMGKLPQKHNSSQESMFSLENYLPKFLFETGCMKINEHSTVCLREKSNLESTSDPKILPNSK